MNNLKPLELPVLATARDGVFGIYGSMHIRIMLLYKGTKLNDGKGVAVISFTIIHSFTSYAL